MVRHTQAARKQSTGVRGDHVGQDHVRALSDVDGSVLEYSDQGNGSSIVMIHAGGFADWFLPTATILRQQGFRVVRLRRAGYGHTAAPCVPFRPATPSRSS
jgi:pimeloyl-ACP methyl ester carboxylesterase